MTNKQIVNKFIKEVKKENNIVVGYKRGTLTEEQIQKKIDREIMRAVNVKIGEYAEQNGLTWLEEKAIKDTNWLMLR